MHHLHRSLLKAPGTPSLKLLVPFLLLHEQASHGLSFLHPTPSYASCPPTASYPFFFSAPSPNRQPAILCPFFPPLIFCFFFYSLNEQAHTFPHRLICTQQSAALLSSLYRTTTTARHHAPAPFSSVIPLPLPASMISPTLRRKLILSTHRAVA